MKRFGLVLVVLLVAPVLFTACSADTTEDAEDYMKALLKGDEEKALELACDSFDDETELLLGWYGEQSINAKSIDLKYDIGKGNREEEVIVTGSYEYGPDKDNMKEFVLSEKENTRIVLWLEKDGDDWCVTDKTEFEGVAVLGTDDAEAGEES